MTQREAALADKLPRAMKHAARHEGLEPEVIRQGLARGTLVLPADRKHHGLKPEAIGRGARVKINANIGTSPHDVSLEKEIDGVVASRIAAHAADIALGVPGAADWDLKMSRARRAWTGTPRSNFR